MTKLIINADDFGYCEAVNHGIISAYRNGVVTSTTIMANMPGFKHAMKLLKKNLGLGCGVHLTLSCHKPLLKDLKTIVDENGHFHRGITNESLQNMDHDEIFEEFCAQIDRVKKYTKVSHIDSHHHVHTLEGLKPVIQKVLEKYNLPIRGGFEYNLDYDKIVPMTDDFYADKVSEDFFEQNLDMLKEHKVIDIMCHPAYLDSYILDSTSYAIPRTKEYEILTSNKVKTFIGQNFELSNYKDR